MILWTRRMQWLQPGRRVFDKRPILFCSVYKKYENNIKLKKVIGIKFVLSRCMQSWPPRRNFPSSLREGYKFNTFSKNPFLIFLHTNPMDTKNAVITTSPKSFWRKAEKFSLNVKKTLKKHTFQKNDLHKDPIVSVSAVLTTPPKISLQSPRKIKFKLYFEIFLFQFSSK